MDPMQDFPHLYTVAADAVVDQNVTLTSPGLEELVSAGPAEFGGPGDLWSPETLLVAAVADCFILSFRAIARAARVEWSSIRCEVGGTLDKIDKVTQFTRFDVRASLVIPSGTDAAKAHAMLEKAERHCLITNSLKAPSHLEARVDVGR